MTSAVAAPNSTRKRVMTIEQALSWAFREELPKARADQSIARSKPPTMSVHPMWRAGVFGGRIDNWNNHDPGFPLALGTPHEDALIIEAAVKGCDVEALDLWDFLIPYRIGEAYDQAGLIEKARRETIAVMINCATSRSRPDCADFVAIAPVRSITGQITVWVRETREYETAEGAPIFVPHDLPTKPVRKGVYPTGAFSKIQFTPSAATVAMDRARYAAWWAALDHVRELLRVSNELKSIEITASDAPRMPWIVPAAEVEAPRVVRGALPTLEDDRTTEAGPAAAAVDDVQAHTLAIRNEVLAARRGFGRRQRPRRHSEVRQIDVRLWKAPAETA